MKECYEFAKYILDRSVEVVCPICGSKSYITPYGYKILSYSSDEVTLGCDGTLFHKCDIQCECPDCHASITTRKFV